jgi:hypothetical protein
MLLASLAVALPASADDCPNSITAKTGFVLERSGTTSQVRPSSPFTHVLNTYSNGMRQDVITFHGLVTLTRFDGSAKSITIPLIDLRTILPLKVGDRRAISFVPADPTGFRGIVSQDLHVSGKETLRLGSCSYDVLVIQNRYLAQDGRIRSQFVDLYSPELGYVLGKRYDEGGGRESVVKFETIRPLSGSKPL